MAVTPIGNTLQNYINAELAKRKINGAATVTEDAASGSKYGVTVSRPGKKLGQFNIEIGLEEILSPTLTKKINAKLDELERQ